MSMDVEVIVVGAGVIGLAVARELAMAGREVLVVEKAPAIGTGTSSRNSEVIHAGIYYEPGSLKARFCVEGKQMLYAFCRTAGVDARAIGKLIVAQSEPEVAKLEAIHATAIRNGVTDLAFLTPAEVARLEPAIRCVAALLSPSTGIVDGHGFMLALQGAAERHGATLALRTEVIRGEAHARGLSLELQDMGGMVSRLQARTIINCAGHSAHAVASAIAGYDRHHLPPRFLARGNYCAVSGKSPFRHLIYPVPVPGALGTHVTLDLQGRARLGPNIEWIDEEDYRVSESIVPEFIKACEGFWPDIHSREITPSYCGIRPKIHGPGQASADFLIQSEAGHGVAGLVNLFGIESPGLTAAMAIARHVAGMVD